MLQITSLHIYPVKSLAGIEIKKSKIVNSGLFLDRQWLITDNHFNFLTQRQIPKMSCIKVSIEANHLILEHVSQQPLHLPLDKQGKSTAAQIWRDNCMAVDQGKEASDWLTQVLGLWRGKELLLLKYDSRHARKTEQSEIYKSFADAYPLLVCNKKSLKQLNEHLTQSECQPIPMARFRANIVIDGLPSFAENKIKSVKSKNGNYLLNMHKPCERCVVTCVDQNKGKIVNNKQPLQALTQLRAQMNLPIDLKAKGAFFGQNAGIMASNKIIAVDDILQL